ncbi:MAG: sigma-70 family RNA polymerase sigma factor, partial [Bacteroidales bacterium]
DLYSSFSIKSYLFASVKINCYRLIQKNKLHEKHNEIFFLQSSDITENEEYDFIDLQSKLMNAISEMPPQRKKVFELSRFEGLKYAQIASKMNISQKTVENHMGSALKFLREKLKDYLILLICFLYN